MKALAEYIAFYEKHTGEAFAFKQPFSFYYSPEHGFCEYLPEGDTLYIWQMCGDGKFWINLALKVCREFKLKYICSYVVRKPLPFIRNLGFKIVMKQNNHGYLRYRGKNKDGEYLNATQFGDRFIFTWEVKV